MFLNSKITGRFGREATQIMSCRDKNGGMAMPAFGKGFSFCALMSCACAALTFAAFEDTSAMVSIFIVALVLTGTATSRIILGGIRLPSIRIAHIIFTERIAAPQEHLCFV